MCLIVNTEKTNILKSLDLEATLTVYKAFGVRAVTKRTGRYLQHIKFNLFRVTGCYKSEYTYFAGEHTADGKIENGKVHNGIHCALNEETAKKHSHIIGSTCDVPVIIPLQIKLEDMVAVGKFSDFNPMSNNDDEIVVNKLVLSQAQVDEIIAKGMILLKEKNPGLFPKRRKPKVV